MVRTERLANLLRGLATRPSRPTSLALLAGPVVAGAWLFAAAMPASADGGPHVAGLNSGVSTLTADGCAGCHRAHTAQGPYLITATTEEALCLTCHGSAGVGATTDVESGIQYKTALALGSGGQNPADPAVVAGALRGGGFVTARIDSGNPTRISYPKWNGVVSRLVADFSSKVPVLGAGQPVTSAHLDLDGSAGVTALRTAWGNGAISATASPGPTLDLSCTSCHNPHGNGQYRILNSIPSDGSGPLVELDALGAAFVTDPPLPATGQTRNYTVKEGALLSNVTTTSATTGDYWRRREPWNWVPTYDPSPGAANHGVVPAPPGGGHTDDRPNGLTAFKGEITAWCSSCHTRYFDNGDGVSVSSGDGIYTFRHAANGSPSCTQCHVAHGSNAVMTDTSYSSKVPYPGSTTPSASSRLLKVDNRGTCQQCHDPTGTIGFNGVISPAP